MAKSLKKYKRPPRLDKEPTEEVEMPPAQEDVRMLTMSPSTAPVKKKPRRRRARAAPKNEQSDEDDGGRVDSGNEGDGLDLQLPVSVVHPYNSTFTVQQGKDGCHEEMKLTSKSLLPFRHRTVLYIQLSLSLPLSKSLSKTMVRLVSLVSSF